MKKALLAAIAALAAATTTASADTSLTALWKQFPFWQVRTDSSVGNGCFMAGHTADGQTTIRIGFDDIQRSGYAALINNNWHSLVPGNTYPVQVRFLGIANSGWATWQATAHQMTGGTVALDVRFTDLKAVWDAVSYASGVQVSYQGQMLLNSNLPGSAQAVAEVMTCEQAMHNATPHGINPTAPTDPFRATAPADPFSHL